jgi:hypothetical protein
LFMEERYVVSSQLARVERSNFRIFPKDQLSDKKV